MLANTHTCIQDGRGGGGGVQVGEDDVDEEYEARDNLGSKRREEGGEEEDDGHGGLYKLASIAQQYRKGRAYDDFLVDDVLPTRPLVDEVGRDTHHNNGAAPLQNTSDELERTKNCFGNGHHFALYKYTLLSIKTKGIKGYQGQPNLAGLQCLKKKKEPRESRKSHPIYVLVQQPSHIKQTSHRAVIRLLRQSRNSGGSTGQVIPRETRVQN